LAASAGWALFVTSGRSFKLWSSKPFCGSRGRIPGAPQVFVVNAPMIGVGWK
jgi:hypothetical protein